MSEGSTKPSSVSFWSLKETPLIKIGGLVILAILAVTAIVQTVVQEAGVRRELKQLAKPTQIRVWSTHTVWEGAVVPAEISGIGKAYKPVRQVPAGMHLSTEDGRVYWLRDEKGDGLFPDDADGLIDIVSSRTEIHPSWQQKPFSKKLFSTLTEKYKEGLEKEGDLPTRLILSEKENKKD